MIKSKIDARERALELAISFAKTKFDDVYVIADKFATFLIGDADLPETQSDTELVKAFLEVMNNEIYKKCNNTPDYEEMLRAIQVGDAGLSAEMPCKSEAE